MPPLRFARVESPIGPMWVAESDVGVAALSPSDSPEAFLAPLRHRFAGFDIVADDVDASWIGGDAIPAVDLRGLAAFDRLVYEVVRGIRSGETMTYGEVAAAIGTPGAARAVGNAMRRCPLFPAVPCHRVVRAADGWSGWGGDPRLKRELLRREADGTDARGMGTTRRRAP